jgi:hypothetical protein
MGDGRSDFDFLFGRWLVHNRKLVDLAGPDRTEWVEFDAVSRAEPILSGLGNVDRIWADEFEGFTLRLFDPDSRLWRIWWASSARSGHVDPPVEGAWENGRGVFLGDDVLNGRPVKVRFEWTNDEPAPRWQQAFSYDGGGNWRVNWVMNLSRID